MGFFGSSTWQPSSARLPTIPQCGKCGLYKTCQSPKMPPAGKGKRSVLVVAEAPGAVEDERGTPLVGKSGEYVRNVLESLGSPLNRLWRTNAVICRPPKNQIEALHIECCRPNLIRTIKELQPKVIILMGSSAVQSLLRVLWPEHIGEIRRWIGWTIPCHRFGAWICPTYHPSYLLRMSDPVLDHMFREHVEAALGMERVPLDTPSLEELEKEVERIHDPRQASDRLGAVLRESGLISFDYETNALKPEGPKRKIVTCSIHANPVGTFSFFLGDDRVNNLLSLILRSPDIGKVGANIKFEDRWTRRMFGHPVRGWTWDTILAAHYLDNREGTTSVKHQAFVQLGIGGYEQKVAPYLKPSKKTGLNRIEECPADDLLLYCGLDSLLEYMLYDRQKQRMSQ